MTACLTKPTAKLLSRDVFRIEYFFRYDREVGLIGV